MGGGVGEILVGAGVEEAWVARAGVVGAWVARACIVGA